MNHISRKISKAKKYISRKKKFDWSDNFWDCTNFNLKQMYDKVQDKYLSKLILDESTKVKKTNCGLI